MEEKTRSKSLAVLEPQKLLQSALEKNSSVETVERLVALAKEVISWQAREAFNVAVAAFQRNCPQIKKNAKASISTRSGGSFGYSYASLDEITEKITPVLSEYGLSVSYRTRTEGDDVFAVCRLSHEMGHFEESGEVKMPVEVSAAGGSGANPAQRVGIAHSYAKRYSLLAITGIAPKGDDPDGKAPKEKPNARPIVDAQVIHEEEPAADPVDQTKIKCHVSAVTMKKDSKKEPYAHVDTSQGSFYCWDKELFKDIGQCEGQAAEIEFEGKESNGCQYRYLRSISVIAPERLSP